MLVGAGHRPAGRRNRSLYEIGCFAALVAVVAIRLPTLSFDSPQYIAIAQGRFADVVAPFSGRVLVPLLSAAIHSQLAVSLATGFAVVALVGAALFVFGVHGVYRRYEIEPYALFPAMLAVPWVIDAIRDAYLPDALVMGLTSLFLLSLHRERSWLLAAASAVLLILARETGLILVMLAVAFALWHRRWWFAALLAGLGVAALVSLKHLAPAVANIHDMNGLLYLALKIPVNFLRNVAGMKFWLNDMSSCAHPMLAIPVGHAVAPFFGKITTIGFCAPDVTLPVSTAALVLSIFGVLPGMALALLLRGRQVLAKDHWLLLVVLYGGAMFVLGTCTGASVYRLLTYGWPLFVIAVPILAKAVAVDEPLARGHVLAMHLGLSWLGPLLGALAGASQWWQDGAVSAVVAVVGLLLNAWAWRLVAARRYAVAA